MRCTIEQLEEKLKVKPVTPVEKRLMSHLASKGELRSDKYSFTRQDFIKCARFIKANKEVIQDISRNFIWHVKIREVVLHPKPLAVRTFGKRKLSRRQIEYLMLVFRLKALQAKGVKLRNQYFAKHYRMKELLNAI